MKIHCEYIDNFKYQCLGEFCWDNSRDLDDLYGLINDLFASHGLQDFNQERLRIRTLDKLLPISKELFFDLQEATLLYLAVVPANAAAVYDREDGLIYFFHTNERNHLYYPHIHVKYNDEEISISLKDFSLTGNFESLKKMKVAIRYVKNHQQKLMTEWDRIE